MADNSVTHLRSLTSSLKFQVCSTRLVFMEHRVCSIPERNILYGPSSADSRCRIGRPRVVSRSNAPFVSRGVQELPPFNRRVLAACQIRENYW
jgi:hypothetical protein